MVFSLAPHCCPWVTFLSRITDSCCHAMSSKIYLDFLPRHASPTTGTAGERLNLIPEVLHQGEANFKMKSCFQSLPTISGQQGFTLILKKELLVWNRKLQKIRWHSWRNFWKFISRHLQIFHMPWWVDSARYTHQESRSPRIQNLSVKAT